MASYELEITEGGPILAKLGFFVCVKIFLKYFGQIWSKVYENLYKFRNEISQEVFLIR